MNNQTTRPEQLTLNDQKPSTNLLHALVRLVVVFCLLSCTAWSIAGTHASQASQSHEPPANPADQDTPHTPGALDLAGRYTSPTSDQSRTGDGESATFQVRTAILKLLLLGGPLLIGSVGLLLLAVGWLEVRQTRGYNRPGQPAELPGTIVMGVASLAVSAFLFWLYPSSNCTLIDQPNAHANAAVR